MRNKIMGCLLVCILAFATPAYAKDITIKINGTIKELDTKPIIVDGYTMVGMRETFNMLGAMVWWDSETSVAHARGSDHEIEIKIGGSEMLVNGNSKPLTVPAQIIDSTTMIPLGVIGEAFGYDVTWNEENKEVVLHSRTEGELSLEDTNILDLEVLSKSQIMLEYDEAVDIAVAKNNSIKNLNDSIERLREQRDEIWNYQLYTSFGTPSSSFIGGLRAISQLDFIEMNAPLNKEILATASEYMLRGSVSAMAQTQIDIALLEENIRLSKFNLENNLELRLKLGLESENAVREQRRAFEQLQTKLNSLKLSLDEQRGALALMLGYDADADVAVRYQPELINDDIDIEKMIKAIDKEPTIIIKERELKQAEYEYQTSSRTLDREMANMPQESKLEKENALVAAQRALADAKTDMEKALRSANNNIKSLQENQKSLELALEKARDAYNTMLVNYEAGLATKYNVDQTRLGIISAEADLLKNLYSLNNLRFAIDRPYILTMSGGQ